MGRGLDLLAGELVVADPDGQGRLLGQFRYVPDYLDHPEAIPLDPIHLPLSPVNLDANRPAAGVHILLLEKDFTGGTL